MKKKIITLSLGIFCLFKLNAQTQTIDISTGVLNGSTTLIAANTNDDTWTVAAPGSGVFQAVKCSTGTLNNLAGTLYPATWAHDANVRWLSPSVDGAGNGTPNGAGGNYTYKMTCTINSYTCLSSATINLTKFGADNNVSSISVNGHAHALAAAFNPLGSATVNVTTDIVIGTNTIQIIVSNAAGSYTGLLVDGNLTVVPGSTDLNPAISGNTQFCKGDALTFTGSAGPAISTNTYWEIAAADASGNVTPGGYVWDQWYTGVPGAFTFPSSVYSSLPCNAYYNIKMAVQNSCIGWVQTVKTIHINCPPIANAGPDDSICSGSCVDVGTLTLTRGVTYTWTTTQNGNVVNAGTGPDPTVCPATTTTYTLTTHNAAGCTATDAVNVYVTNNDPSFSIFVNTALTSYFTVTTYASNTNAYSDPGFVYEFSIQELDGSGNPIYTDNGTDAWWFYPNNSLKGFDATGYPAGGNFTQTAWWAPAPNDGRFLYGHTYKITRGTKNNICNTYSTAYVIITPAAHMMAQNGSGQKMDVLEGKDADDFMKRLATANSIENTDNELSVYPNPGNGVFSIATTSANGGIMEVYDIRGTKIQSVEIKNTDTYSLDLSGYAKGIYMIKMNVDNKVITKKIILQ